MKKTKASYAETVVKAQLLETGITNNRAVLEKRGIDAEYIARFATLKKNVLHYNDLQEKLKADLKAQTEKLTNELDELVHVMSEAKKLIKLTVPQVQWKEFGIDDKR